MPRSVRTFLMFEGSAESAMDLYTSVFSGSEVRGVDRYGPGEGPEGKVKRAELSLAGYELMFFDSPMEHEFTFTPAISLFVECESEDAPWRRGGIDAEKSDRPTAGERDGPRICPRPAGRGREREEAGGERVRPLR
jgi:hypothetical protein